MPTLAATVLSPVDWEQRASAHRTRADALTAGRRERAARGESHAIEDFLFEYYNAKPGQLRRWHPGIGVGLQAADAHAGQRWYVTRDGVSSLDVATFAAERGDTALYVRRLLVATAGRAPHQRHRFPQPAGRVDG